MLIAHSAVIRAWARTKSIGKGIKKQLVKTGSACMNASIGWNAKPENGVTALDWWWIECSLE